MSEEVRAENCSDFSHISKMTVELFTILWYNLNTKIVQQIGICKREVFMEREILLLGNPQLYETSEDVKKEELEDLRPVFEDMFDCIKGIRRDYGFGRAIAAPQIGIKKRLICILTDKPYVIINPTLEFIGDEMMELMDDCMSFPKLLVRVRRYRHCILRYTDENWEKQEMRMDDDMSELIQHEYDHLDGILATMRAIDNKSFVMKK